MTTRHANTFPEFSRKTGATRVCDRLIQETGKLTANSFKPDVNRYTYAQILADKRQNDCKNHR